MLNSLGSSNSETMKCWGANKRSHLPGFHASQIIFEYQGLQSDGFVLAEEQKQQDCQALLCVSSVTGGGIFIFLCGHLSLEMMSEQDTARRSMALQA